MAARKGTTAKPKATPEDDFYGSPAEKGNTDSRKWEYEEGDSLAGEVVSVFEADGEYGPYTGYVVKPNPQYTTEAGGDSSAVSEDDPLVWYVNDNSAAARSIPRSGIEVGDKVRIDFLGMGESKAGREFKDFAVKVAKFEASA